jgi:hypothetical protein
MFSECSLNVECSQRYFIMTRGGTNMAHLLAAAGKEREYTSTYIEMAPDNESAWTYARALPSGKKIKRKTDASTYFCSGGGSQFEVSIRSLKCQLAVRSVNSQFEVSIRSSKCPFAV